MQLTPTIQSGMQAAQRHVSYRNIMLHAGAKNARRHGESFVVQVGVWLQMTTVLQTRTLHAKICIKICTIKHCVVRTMSALRALYTGWTIKKWTIFKSA